MSSSSLKNHFNRVLSILLIYVLFLNEFIPFSNACVILRTETFNFKASPGIAAKLIENVSIYKSDSNELIANEVIATSQKVSAQSLNKLMATSSGPGQAESSGFSLASTDGMVDKFTGDFSYSIPLMNVEGYPLTLSYNSNVGMNSEASWVGLGWDLSVGAVSREMRGLPDEFNGTDQVIRTYNQREENIEDGFKAGVYAGTAIKFKKKSAIFTPGIQHTALWGSYTSQYLGIGRTFDFGLQVSFSISGGAEDQKTQNISVSGPFGTGSYSFGYSKDTKQGIGINTSFGLSGGYAPSSDKDVIGGSLSATFGSSFNSRSGLMAKSLTMGIAGGYEKQKAEFNGTIGYSGTSTVTYGSATGIPRVMITSNSKSYQLNTDLFIGAKLPLNITARIGSKIQNYENSSSVVLNNHQIIQPAYGYLHSGKRNNDNRDNVYPVMDFNRSTDFAYSTEMSNLPFSTQTFDIFYVNALGMNATFRAGRDDFGTYYDPITTSQLNVKDDSGLIPDDVVNLSLGFSTDLSASGPGYTISAGASAGSQTGDVKSGVWEELATLHFENTGNYTTNKEFDGSVYFKGIGELTPNDMGAWNSTGGYMADNFDVNKVNKEITLTDFLKESDTHLTGSALNQVNQKPIRANCFVPKIANEISGVSQYNIYSYSAEGSLLNTTTLPRISATHLANHISAIEVVSTNGMKYTYGLPAYNISNYEVSFASGNIDDPNNPAAALIYDGSIGMVQYDAGVDNSVDNQRGRSHYYDKAKMPAFAHSFLLTSMTSSDYIDRKNDGPTLDDIGSYYKINYTQKYGASNLYQWRFPVSGGAGDIPIANQNRGLLGTELDDIANYTYGEKEIWYTHSIESKNQIAFIYLKDRDDAYGVLNENGILKTDMPLMCIDKIVLYNLSEFQKDPTSAIPLQTVEFEYDYTLCLHSPSNKNSYNGGPIAQSGKLTLKKIRIYSGNSQEMGLMSYKFDYSTQNPDFNYLNIDGWGNYKPNNTTRPNDIFPYAEQDNSSAILDQRSQAWKLTSVTNPLGGVLEISYEADRYGYTQSKKAMRHFEVYKMTNLIEFLMIQDQLAWNGTSNVYNTFRNENLDVAEITSQYSSFGYSTSNSNFQNFISGIFHEYQFMKYISKFGKYKEKFIPNNVIIFKLDKPLSVATKQIANDVVREKYFKKEPDGQNLYLQELFFKIMVNVKTDVKELIPAFAKISDDFNSAFGGFTPFPDSFKAFGVMPANSSGDYEYGYVVIDPVNTGHFEVPNDKGQDGNGLIMHPLQRAALDYVRQNLPDKIYGSCASCDGDLSIDRRTVYGADIYKYMIDDAHYVPSIFLNESSIRLLEPDAIKFGGNARVKQIKYKDNWNAISTEYDSEYSWSYQYSDRSKETGVSSFEAGGIFDESPFYYWDTYINIAKRFPDETKFNVTPISAALFPNPVVGYQEVKVQFSDLNTQGYSLTSYHTYKEKKYNTIEKKTILEKSKSVSKLSLIKAYGGNSFALYGFTQGYEVETNDFHGKIDKIEIFNKINVVQSRTKYTYKDLNAKIPMLDRKGVLSDEDVALEYDIHVDSRFVEDETKFYILGLGASFSWPIIKIRINPIFSRQNRMQGFYSNCLIKHINRSAVVESIQTEYLGSINTAKNLIYDKYSGQVIASSLTDEFNDKLYSFNYPSHWYYDELCELCPASSSAPVGTFNQGNFTTTSLVDITDYYSSGDYVKFSQVGGSVVYYGYLLTVNTLDVIVINQDGTIFNSGGGLTYNMSLVKSNRDNRLSESMQSMVTKEAILTTPTLIFNFPTEEIISSSVLTYRSKQNVRCGRGEDMKNSNEVAMDAIINPFYYGIIGDLVPKDQFVWQQERINATHPHGIRFDGTYQTYVPFYGLDLTSKEWFSLPETEHPNHIVGNDYQKWRDLGQVYLYDEYGKPLEGKDQIDIPSSVLYGYNEALNLVPVAQAVNARKQEIAFDGFEDYLYHSASNNPTITSTHFDFSETLYNGIVLTSEKRHSGLNSILIPQDSSAVVTKKVTNACDIVPYGITETGFVASSCVCIPNFEPTPGKSYLIGAWVNQKNTGAQVKVVLLDGGSVISTYNFTPSGNIIEGWQRIEGTFPIPPSGISNIEVSLVGSGTETVYFDDFRFHPFLAGMTTVVYDPKTLLPLATHDGYNYTTFYNYDENLNLVRVKVETSEGIKTISESEFGGLKDPKQ